MDNQQLDLFTYQYANEGIYNPKNYAEGYKHLAFMNGWNVSIDEAKERLKEWEKQYGIKER